MRGLCSLLILVWLQAGGALCLAQEKIDTLDVKGEVYKKVTVTRVTDTHLQFIHSRGSASVKLKDLSPELQKQFGFDAPKSAAAEESQKAADVRYRAEVQASKPVPKVNTQRVDDSDDIVVPKLYAKSFRGNKPPDLEVENWLDSAPDTQGKFILIDFWATWCGPCRASIPHLNQLQFKFGDKLVVIGLTAEPLSTVKSMKSPKIEYAVASDTQRRMQSAAQVTGIPHAMLIDPSGIVRFEGMPHYLDEKGLSRLLEKYAD